LADIHFSTPRTDNISQDKKVVGSSHAETFILREQATGKFRYIWYLFFMSLSKVDNGIDRIQVGDQTLAFYLDRNENDVQVGFAPHLMFLTQALM